MPPWEGGTLSARGGKGQASGGGVERGRRVCSVRPVRDRRWDYLYDRQKQPVKEFILEKFAEHLAEELRAWPPPFVEWLSEEQRARYEAGTAERPRDDVLRFALELARLDLAREYDAYEAAGQRAARGAGSRRRRTPPGRCWSCSSPSSAWSSRSTPSGARLGRGDLVRALELVERRLYPRDAGLSGWRTGSSRGGGPPPRDGAVGGVGDRPRTIPGGNRPAGAARTSAPR